MKLRLCVLAALLLAASSFTRPLAAQEADSSDPEQPVAEQNAKANQLTIEEQLKLRAAQQAAAEDPGVKEALTKRTETIEAFRKALHDAMIKADPQVAPILEKIAVGKSPGF